MGWHPLRRRREREFARLDAFRSARKLLDEDLTVFGEQLAQLQAERSSSEAGWAVRAEHQQAVDCHEKATSMRAAAETAEDVGAIDAVLTDGRFHLACLLALRDGADLPTRGSSCFFNAQHGPAATEVAWAPPIGPEQQIQVCRLDADRLAAGEPADVRMVRVGDRYVPWYDAGDSIVMVMQRHEHGAYNTTARTDKHVAEGRARGEIAANSHWSSI